MAQSKKKTGKKMLLKAAALSGVALTGCTHPRVVGTLAQDAGTVVHDGGNESDAAVHAGLVAQDGGSDSDAAAGGGLVARDGGAPVGLAPRDGGSR